MGKLVNIVNESCNNHMYKEACKYMKDEYDKDKDEKKAYKMAKEKYKDLDHEKMKEMYHSMYMVDK